MKVIISGGGTGGHGDGLGGWAGCCGAGCGVGGEGGLVRLERAGAQVGYQWWLCLQSQMFFDHL